ncbi:hypothetical protein GCM10027348_14510 [Hymenobacter tenuis]
MAFIVALTFAFVLLSNGILVSASDFSLTLPNRGLFFNDGFFETLVWQDGSIRYGRHHVRRMQRAAAALGLVLPATLATEATLTATLAPLAAATAPEAPPAVARRLRVQLWRSGGGLYTPTTDACEWLATAQPFQALETSIRTADFAQTVRTHASAVSFCKGPNALTYVLAAREREQRGLDEVVLLSGQGHVAEAVAAAIAWLQNGTIYTPSEATGCVAGTRLAHLRTHALQLGIKWQEGLYQPGDLLAAEAVFTANIAGLRAVQQLGSVRFNSETHPLLVQLRAAEKNS